MVDDLIPDDVRQFILRFIESVAHLEGLLLLRSDPQTAWTVDQVAGRLYIDKAQAAGVLAYLSANGFLNTTGSPVPAYSYRPASRELAQTVDRVAEYYSKYLIPVTNLIHSRPKPKIQQFADAFRLRKDK
jgi:DNA-binding MarR family transcriptional regulator